MRLLLLYVALTALIASAKVINFCKEAAHECIPSSKPGSVIPLSDLPITTHTSNIQNGSFVFNTKLIYTAPASNVSISNNLDIETILTNISTNPCDGQRCWIHIEFKAPVQIDFRIGGVYYIFGKDIHFLPVALYLVPPHDGIEYDYDYQMCIGDPEREYTDNYCNRDGRSHALPMKEVKCSGKDWRACSAKLWGALHMILSK